MKRVIKYRSLLGVTHENNLAELKTAYRNIMKESHPDKIQDNEELIKDAENHSKNIIEAYHFLVSISPETHIRNTEEYTDITENSIIDDFEYKGQTLKISFHDGSSYEYFGVPKSIYLKFLNSNTRSRFAKRHIFHSHIFRNISKKAVA